MRTTGRIRRWLAVAAMGLGGVAVALGVPAPAHAASATIKVADGILFRNCAEHPARVAVSVPSSAKEWVVNVRLYDTDGEDRGVLTRTGTSSGTATTRWTFCLNAHPAGDYQIRIDGYWVDSADDIHSFAPASKSFHMRISRSRTRITVSDPTPHPRERVTVRARTVQERPGGKWGPADWGYIRLQRRGDGPWRNMDNSYFVNDNGAVVWKLVWLKRNSFDLRAFAHDLQGVRPSKSGPVTIRVRRGG